MYKKTCGSMIAVFLVLCCLAGCKSARLEPLSEAKVMAPELTRAEALYRQKKYTAAMIECIDVARSHPDAAGLSDLQNRIMTRLTELRSAQAAARTAATSERMMVDLNRHLTVPHTYGLDRFNKGETDPMRTELTDMERVLRTKVVCHLDNVGLDDFILAIGAAENVNIVADNVDNTKTMTLHAEDVPLIEILDYVSRNLGVAFSVGENIIWATPRDTGESGIPMETRVYRLRKGISSREIEDGENINIVQAVRRFVPVLDGSDLLFDSKAHVLIAKNTRENLTRIEDLIEELDVAPPQVLIEARFISTSVSDLTELGIDWILDSPIVVSRKRVMEDGTVQSVPKTQINATDPDNIVGFTSFANEGQGLNLTYQGLLTDPMFRAVIHALETSDDSRTLSVPKVTTVNNRTATIRIGEDFRFFEEYDIESTPSTTDDGETIYRTTLVPVGTPELEELGIELSVTPSVGADRSTINLNVQPEISEFVRYERYEVGDDTDGTAASSDTNATSLVKLPIFRRSKIETEVIVQSGETVVMGGLISSSESKTQEKVPFLSSIPILGKLFMHDGVSEDKQNLLIFVTATLLSNRGENLIPLTARGPAPEGG